MSESLRPSSALSDDINLALAPLVTFLGLYDAYGDTVSRSKFPPMEIAQVAYDLLDGAKAKLMVMADALEEKVGRIEFVRESAYPYYLGPIIDVIVVPPHSHR